MEVERRFPSIESLVPAARRRVPRFAWEYFIGGIGPETCVQRNRDDLNRVLMRPRYLTDADTVDYSVELFGRRYAAPVGVAPIGLGGLIWPRAAELLAAAARRNNLVFTLSSYATASLEAIAEIAGEHAWFQLYPVNIPDIEASLIKRAVAAGYSTMVVTVDIPTATARERDVKNGLSVPPKIQDWRTAMRIAARPTWALAMAASGIPRFRNLLAYTPPGASLEELGAYLTRINEGHVTPERLKSIRDLWPGRLIVKGILDPEEARLCAQMGVDAVVVSNHGGRQLDAAPSSVSMLPAIRAAVPENFVVMADGGIRSGLDVARMIASGADFVLLGRAFMYGVAALGDRGGDRVAAIIKEELRQSMTQLGCRDLASLKHFRHPDRELGGSG